MKKYEALNPHKEYMVEKIIFAAHPLCWCLRKINMVSPERDVLIAHSHVKSSGIDLILNSEARK